MKKTKKIKLTIKFNPNQQHYVVTNKKNGDATYAPTVPDALRGMAALLETQAFDKARKRA